MRSIAGSGRGLKIAATPAVITVMLFFAAAHVGERTRALARGVERPAHEDHRAELVLRT